MSISARVVGRVRPLDIISYSVNEDATPLAPGDSSGGIGQITINCRAVLDGPLKDRTAILTDRKVQLIDAQEIEDTPFKGRGSIYGKITNCSQPGERASFAVDTLITRLNVERSAKPFFGVRSVSDLVTVRTNLIANPSIEVATTGYVGIPGTTGVGTLSRQTPGGVFGPAGAESLIRYQWSTASTAAGGGMSYLQTGLAAGNTYTASAYVNIFKTAAIVTGVSDQRISIRLDWYTPASAFVSSSTATYEVNRGGFSRLAVTGTVPSTADRAVIAVVSTAGTGYANWAIGDRLELDGVMLEQASAATPYFDGSSAGAVWTGTADASSSVHTATVTQQSGYDATVGSAFRYYCGLVDIPETSIIVDPIFEGQPVAYGAWTGNVWDYVKRLCTAVGAQVRMENDLIAMREPRRHVIPVESTERFTQTVDSRTVAQNIQIYNYNNRWGVNELAYTAVSAERVESGDVIEVLVTTEASLISVNNPICVAAITPKPYVSGSGQYVVTDAENRLIDPTWWNANGGSIKAGIAADDPHTIVLIISAPNEDSTHKGPFRMSEYINAIDTPALFLTGEGVFVNKQIVTIPTGAAVATTATVTAPLIDNLFLSNISQVHDRGILAAQNAAGPIVRISGTLAYDPSANGQEFGVLPGARIKIYDGIYRVTSVSYSPGSIGIDAVMDMTFDDLVDLFALTFDEFNATYAGLTFDAFNALWPGGTTFDDFNGQVAAPTFDTFNALFDGLTFDNYSVFPYTKEVEVDGGIS